MVNARSILLLAAAASAVALLPACDSSRPVTTDAGPSDTGHPDLSCRSVLSQNNINGAQAFNAQITVAQVFSYTSPEAARLNKVEVSVSSTASMPLYPFWVAITSVHNGEPAQALAEQRMMPTKAGGKTFHVGFWDSAIQLQPGKQYAIRLRSQAPNTGLSPHWTPTGITSVPGLKTLLVQYKGVWKATSHKLALYMVLRACR